MDYGIKLKKIRQELGMSQDEVAKNLNIARITYSHYETQEKIIPVTRLNEISNFYNVSIDYILGLTNIANYTNVNKEIDTSKTIIRLKSFRKKHKLTQKTLAQELSTANTTISGYELGTRILATPFLYTICSKYHISADYLLGRIDEPKYLK